MSLLAKWLAKNLPRMNQYGEAAANEVMSANQQLEMAKRARDLAKISEESPHAQNYASWFYEPQVRNATGRKIDAWENLRKAHGDKHMMEGDAVALAMIAKQDMPRRGPYRGGAQPHEPGAQTMDDVDAEDEMKELLRYLSSED
jgi:hypothetical protein